MIKLQLTNTQRLYVLRHVLVLRVTNSFSLWTTLCYTLEVVKANAKVMSLQSRWPFTLAPPLTLLFSPSVRPAYTWEGVDDVCLGKMWGFGESGSSHRDP